MANATEADIVSAITTEITVKGGAPATPDEAGYTAYFTGAETEIGLVEDFTPPSSSSTVEEFSVLKTGEIVKVTTFTNAGEATIVCAHAISDDGHAMLVDYHNGANKNKQISFKFANPDGSMTFYTGKVSGYEHVKLPLNRSTFTISVDKKMVEVAAP